MIKIYLYIMVLFAVGFGGVHLCLREEASRRFGLVLYATLAVLYAICVFTHGGLIFRIALAAMVLVSPGDETAVGCRYLALLMLIPNVNYPVMIGHLYLLDLSAVGAMSLAAMIAVFARPRLPGALRKFTVEDALVLVLFLILGVAADRIDSPTAHMRLALSMLIAIVMPYAVLRRTGGTRQAFYPLIETLAGAAIIVAVIAVYQALHHWSLFDIIWSNQSFGNMAAGEVLIRGGLMRAKATFADAISCADFEMLGIFAIYAARRSFRSDALWLGAMALVGLGMLAAQSRGSLVALAVGFITIEIARRRFARAAAALALAAILGSGVLLAAHGNARVAQFVMAGQSSTSSDLDYRQTLLRRGLQEGEKHLWTGNDANVMLADLSDLVQGEHIVDMVNSYLYFFLVSGLAGTIPLALLMAAAMRKSFARSRTEARDHGFAVTQGFVYSALPGLLVALTVTSFYERMPAMLLLALVANRGLHRGPVTFRVAGASRDPAAGAARRPFAWKGKSDTTAAAA
ncbi:MAG: hypothetical protein KGK11_08010 [Sphingomonadales bacterium]|nr:hypothetical protein [Sphingomonadales bacterium]